MNKWKPYLQDPAYLFVYLFIIGVGVFWESLPCFYCSVPLSGIVAGAQACWCPGRILRKADRGGPACRGQQRSGAQGLPTVITWGWKTSQPGREERVCERREGDIGGQRHPARPEVPDSGAISAWPAVPSILLAIVCSRAGPGTTGSCWTRALSLSLALLTDSSCFVFARLFFCLVFFSFSYWQQIDETLLVTCLLLLCSVWKRGNTRLNSIPSLVCGLVIYLSIFLMMWISPLRSACKCAAAREEKKRTKRKEFDIV